MEDKSPNSLDFEVPSLDYQSRSLLDPKLPNHEASKLLDYQSPTQKQPKRSLATCAFLLGIPALSVTVWVGMHTRFAFHQWGDLLICSVALVINTVLFSIPQMVSFGFRNSKVIAPSAYVGSVWAAHALVVAAWLSTYFTHSPMWLLYYFPACLAGCPFGMLLGAASTELWEARPPGKQ